MAQWLRVLSALLLDPSLIPSTNFRWLPVILDPGKLMPFCLLSFFLSFFCGGKRIKIRFHKAPTSLLWRLTMSRPYCFGFPTVVSVFNRQPGPRVAGVYSSR